MGNSARAIFKGSVLDLDKMFVVFALYIANED